ncbi:MAG: hypothetical protein Q9166_002655 [cf. Caloplaca sp. 2 TL-2023]
MDPEAQFSAEATRPAPPLLSTARSSTFAGEPYPPDANNKFLLSIPEALQTFKTVLESIQPPRIRGLHVSSATEIARQIFIDLRTHVSTLPDEPQQPDPDRKFFLSIPVALQKLETVMQAIQPPRDRGPKVFHATEIARQVFEDLQMQVPEVGIDELWGFHGQKAKILADCEAQDLVAESC